MSIIIAFVIGIIIGGIWFSRKTDWKCESCVNYGCVANDSICDHCNGKNHYEYDTQRFLEKERIEEDRSEE